MYLDAHAAQQATQVPYEEVGKRRNQRKENPFHGICLDTDAHGRWRGDPGKCPPLTGRQMGLCAPEGSTAATGTREAPLLPITPPLSLDRVVSTSMSALGGGPRLQSQYMLSPLAHPMQTLNSLLG